MEQNMRNKVPVSREDRPPLPDFAPVPLRYRHDGWTPERQRGFIEALADTGCVSRATAIVNMSLEGVYYLRRQKGAEEFRAAWDAALDFGVQKLKDIAFERAIEGEMIPIFTQGKLMGFRRKRNDRLLMFCLRHYGQDANGKRTTINYFSSRAQAGSAAGEGSGSIAAAEASTTTVRTVISGNGINGAGKAADSHAAAQALQNFEGVELDAEAQAAIIQALEACAARYRADIAQIEAADYDDAVAILVDDPEENYVPACKNGNPFHGELYPPTMMTEYVPFQEGEAHWTLTGALLHNWAQPEEVQQAWRERAEQEAAALAAAEAEAEAATEAELFGAPKAPPGTAQTGKAQTGKAQTGKAKPNGKQKAPDISS
jgi:hypothetical protein